MSEYIEMMRRTEYSEAYKDGLVAILRQNVPKYFSERDVADFQRYLSERNWNGHDVFVDQDHRIIGCASYYVVSVAERAGWPDCRLSLRESSVDSSLLSRSERRRKAFRNRNYVKSASAVGLAWMFFAPLRLGSRRLLPALEEYLASIRVRVGASDSALTFVLNTTPRVARLLGRIGFVTIETAKDGYGPGYDRVRMERAGIKAVKSARTDD